MFMVIFLIRKLGKDDYWPSLKSWLVSLDAFKEEHVKEEDTGHEEGEGRVMGGLCTLGALALCGIIVVIQAYLFFNVRDRPSCWSCLHANITTLLVSRAFSYFACARVPSLPLLS